MMHVLSNDGSKCPIVSGSPLTDLRSTLRNSNALTSANLMFAIVPQLHLELLFRKSLLPQARLEAQPAASRSHLDDALLSTLAAQNASLLSVQMHASFLQEAQQRTNDSAQRD